MRVFLRALLLSAVLPTLTLFQPRIVHAQSSAVPTEYETVFFDDFESTALGATPQLSSQRWQESVRAGRFPTNARVFADPLSSARGNVMGFASPQGGDDIWSVRLGPFKLGARISFYYMGDGTLTEPALQDNLGGFFGVGKNVIPPYSYSRGAKRYWLAGTFRNYVSTPAVPFQNEPFRHLEDNTGWNRYEWVLSRTQMKNLTTFQLMFEDFPCGCTNSLTCCNRTNIGGDAFFDDVRVERALVTCGDNICDTEEGETFADCEDDCVDFTTPTPPPDLGLIFGLTGGGLLLGVGMVAAAALVLRLRGQRNEYSADDLQGRDASSTRGNGDSAFPPSGHYSAVNSSRMSPDMDSSVGSLPSHGSVTATPGNPHLSIPSSPDIGTVGVYGEMVTPSSGASGAYGDMPSPAGQSYGEMPTPSPGSQSYGSMISPAGDSYGEMPQGVGYGSMPDIPDHLK